MKPSFSLTTPPPASKTVDEALLRKVAELARLHLTDEEVRTFTPQLSQVLGYVEKLAEVDVAGVEPLTHPLEIPVRLRPDQARSLSEAERAELLSCAPEILDSGFRVPPIVTGA